MINSICIVRLSALGDVLMLVPLLRTLQFNFPNAAISWVISEPAYDLVAGINNVEFIVINKPKSLFDYWRFKKKMAKYKFDVLIAAQANLRANLLYPLIKASRKIGYDSHRAKDGHNWFIKESISPGCDHTLESFLKFSSNLGCQQKQIYWDLFIPQDSYQWVANNFDLSKAIVIINPAASKPERSWISKRYIALIRVIIERWPVQIVLTGGPNPHDYELTNKISKKVKCLNFCGKTKIKQLLALISKAKVLIAPDTGPSHMAAAVGTPVIALHAVTSSKVSGPYNFQHLAIDHYPQAMKLRNQKIEQKTWGTHAHGENTMQLIQVEEVLNKLEEIL